MTSTFFLSFDLSHLGKLSDADIQNIIKETAFIAKYARKELDSRHPDEKLEKIYQKTYNAYLQRSKKPPFPKYHTLGYTNWSYEQFKKYLESHGIK